MKGKTTRVCAHDFDVVASEIIAFVDCAMLPLADGGTA